MWLLVGAAVLGGVLLFSVLDNQRRAKTAPTTQVRTVDGVRMSSALPPLHLVPEPAMEPPPPPPPPGAFALPIADQPAPPLMAAPPVIPSPQSLPSPVFQPPQPTIDPQTAPSRGQILVVDTTASAAGRAAAAGPAAGGDGPIGAAPGALTASAPDPVRATQLRRRATTVPQGTLIIAVLETALDSTRPGYVRAMVSRDITGFDGSQVLIPRGTRLFGEYQADLAPGQNRAFVQWTQLVRPDGVAIAIASPAADRLGRAGVKGRVDSHFLQRFGAAFLQSTLNLGLGWAGRNIGGDNSVIVALPGSNQGGGTPLTGNQQIQPTLRVDAGTTVTVFVARDLEFPPNEGRR